MKKGINQWSFPDTMDLRQCFALARDAGFDGVELIIAEEPVTREEREAAGAEHLTSLMSYLGFLPYQNNEFTLESGGEQLRSVKALAEEYDLEIPSVATVLPFVYPLSSADEAMRQRGVEVVRRSLEMAALVGADDLLTIPALVGRGERYDEALEWSRQSLAELAPVAEELGVGLAVENVWNLALLSPLEFRDFIDSFESPAVGAYFDVGNVIVTGLGEHWIPLLGERIRKVHFDNFRGEIGNATGFTRHLLDGAVNWPGVMDALHEIGYDGWVIAEITPPAPHYPEKVIYDISSSMDWIIEGGQPAS